MSDTAETEKLIEKIAPIIMESCMQSIQMMARRVAESVPLDMNGRTALELFAASMLKANERVWPKEGLGQ